MLQKFDGAMFGDKARNACHEDRRIRHVRWFFIQRFGTPLAVRCVKEITNIYVYTAGKSLQRTGY